MVASSDGETLWYGGRLMETGTALRHGERGANAREAASSGPDNFSRSLTPAAGKQREDDPPHKGCSDAVCCTSHEALDCTCVRHGGSNCGSSATEGPFVSSPFFCFGKVSQLTEPGGGLLCKRVRGLLGVSENSARRSTTVQASTSASAKGLMSAQNQRRRTTVQSCPSLSGISVEKHQISAKDHEDYQT